VRSTAVKALLYAIAEPLRRRVGGGGGGGGAGAGAAAGLNVVDFDRISAGSCSSGSCACGGSCWSSCTPC